jgi:hypothetical protein
LLHLEATLILASYSLVRIDFEQSNVRTMAVNELPLSWADCLHQKKSSALARIELGSARDN